MTIRRTLLRAFLLVGLVPVVLVALVGFSRASRALQDEIEHGLAAQAEAVASDIDKLVYERLQNAATWSRLEVMQDLQVGDVDKRLSAFLQRLQRGYGGLYLGLSAADRTRLGVGKNWRCDDVTFYVERLSFEQLGPARAGILEAIPTRFTLPAEQIDLLIQGGADTLRESRVYRSFRGGL